MGRVVVVGGGITGLTAAFRLATEHPEIAVTLLESSDRLGGKLRTERIGSITVEAGADSFLARTPEGPELCRSLGIDDELITPSVFGGLVWIGGRLRPIPPGTVMGVPTSARAILNARPLTPPGKIRALADLVLPGRVSGPDISVGALVRRRFGDQTMERLVDPLLAGTRAGDPDSMSLRAALPDLDRAARSHASVIRGSREVGVGGSDPPRFLAPRAGMSRIVEALVDHLSSVDVRTGLAATSIERAKRGYVVRTSGDERFEASGMILALPAHAAARLLGSLSGTVARGLEAITHASVAVVTLVYGAGSLGFPTGSSGFLLPSKTGLTVSAGTWWSAKWPHTTPEGEQVVRAFVGRAGRSVALGASDDQLAAGVAKELGLILDTTVRPLRTHVTRWHDALPQYEVGHWDRISRIEAALEPDHGIILAGADYRGSGIPDCIREGTNAARRVAAAV